MVTKVYKAMTKDYVVNYSSYNIIKLNYIKKRNNLNKVK